MKKKRPRGVSSLHRSISKKKLKQRNRQRILENRTRRYVALGLTTATVLAFVVIGFSKTQPIESSKQFENRLGFYYLTALLVLGSAWALYDWLKHR
ncbi:MAG: hypothetical protein KJT03_00455 [Verrucomicrobiae bacterium]|nr:hypothetical protein [Verrucomicrobiae bacterium]